MLLPVFRDLIKPQWRSILEELKRSGGMPVSDLSRAIRISYMSAKVHCEELTKAGYVIRTRLPRIAVGRPEIFYSLAAKSDALFPQAGVDFTLDLLDEVRQMVGESGPEKLLFQYFQKRQNQWIKLLEKLPSFAEKAVKLTRMREKDGHACHCESEPGGLIRIVEFHNPLQRVFERYPRAVGLETRMIEALLGCRVTRSEFPTGRETPPRVVFEIP